MENREYLVRMLGFYRANNIESLPAQPGVLMIFVGTHIGERKCRISQFLSAVAADSILSAAEQKVKSVGPANLDNNETIYCAYVQCEHDDAVKLSEVLNIKFGASGYTDIKSQESAMDRVLVHVQLDGAVPIIWNDTRDFTLSI